MSTPKIADECSVKISNIEIVSERGVETSIKEVTFNYLDGFEAAATVLDIAKAVGRFNAVTGEPAPAEV